MATNEIVSPYFENGVFSAVRVTLGDEDFVIAPKDHKCGQKMSWQDAMGSLNADNLDTWNCHQIYLTMAYRDEINKLLKDNGGEKFINCWTRDDCSSYSFRAHGCLGIIDPFPKIGLCSMRPIKNLKTHIVTTDEIISPYFENDVFAGVRVTLGDEDFVIAPEDYKIGKRMHWDEAMDVLKADNLTTWNHRQICLAMAYRKEINKVLRNNHSMKLTDSWSCDEYSSSYSFYVLAHLGVIDAHPKNSLYRLRPIKNLKNL